MQIRELHFFADACRIKPLLQDVSGHCHLVLRSPFVAVITGISVPGNSIGKPSLIYLEV